MLHAVASNSSPVGSSANQSENAESPHPSLWSAVACLQIAEGPLFPAPCAPAGGYGWGWGVEVGLGDESVDYNGYDGVSLSNLIHTCKSGMAYGNAENTDRGNERERERDERKVRKVRKVKC